MLPVWCGWHILLILKDNFLFPVFLVEFCTYCPLPEAQILRLLFLLLHCGMTYLMLATTSLLGGQHTHGQLIWTMRRWCVHASRCYVVASVCALASRLSWWLPTKGSKIWLWILGWNSAPRARHLKVKISTGEGVWDPTVSGDLVNTSKGLESLWCLHVGI